MMNKKLKYIEFMGDDIFKVITIEDGMISFPWMMGSLEWQYSDAGTEFGAKDNEVLSVWLKVKRRLLSMLE